MDISKWTKQNFWKNWGPALPKVSLSIFLFPKSSLTLHSHLSVSYPFLRRLSILFLVFQVDDLYLFFLSEHYLIHLHQLSTHVPTALAVYILYMWVYWVFHIDHTTLNYVSFHIFLGCHCSPVRIYFFPMYQVFYCHLLSWTKSHTRRLLLV